MANAPARVAGVDPPFPREYGNEWNVTRAVAHSRAAYGAVILAANELNGGTELAPRLREVAILRIGALLECDYEWSRHVPRALNAGLTETALRSIRSGASEDLEPSQQLVMAYAEAVDSCAVDDELWNSVVGLLTVSQAVELTALIAFYGQMCRILLALRVNIDEDVVGHLDKR